MLGLGKILREELSTQRVERMGSSQEAKQALNAGAAEALGTGRPWLLGEQEKNGASIPEGSSECLEDCWSSDRHRKGAWTAGLGREERLKKLAFF